jgi:hypothetical protein
MLDGDGRVEEALRLVIYHNGVMEEETNRKRPSNALEQIYLQSCG